MANPIEDLIAKAASIRDGIVNLWTEDSSAIIALGIILVLIFLCLIFVASVLTSGTYRYKIDKWGYTKQYWRDKRNSKLLPRGYFSSMRRIMGGKVRKGM